MNTEHERLSWTRFQAELIKRTMRRLRANPDFARRGGVQGGCQTWFLVFS